jgi:hypothetical protein
MKRALVGLLVLVALPVLAVGQTTVSKTDSIELTAKIEAIDYTARTVTLKDKDGELETITCGPEVKRFSELKVGDTVTFRYYESTAFAIRKPGQPAGAPPDATKVTRAEGTKPAATIAKQQTAVVTVKAIDEKVPAITVLTEDGRTLSFKVDKKENLKGVAAGDKVEVTFTEAVMISVK